MKVNEIFYSLSGEGKSIGTPTIFVRVSGCNINPPCMFCDTKEALSKGIEMDIDEIIENIKRYTSVNECRNISFTGGEPTIYLDEIYEIINKLRTENVNYTFEMETNGTNNFEQYKFDIVTISPKLGQINYNIIEKYLIYQNIYFKFVIDNDSELDTYLKIIDKYKIKDRSIFMPKGTDLVTITEIGRWLAKHCIDNNIKFSTRLHILLGIR